MNSTNMPPNQQKPQNKSSAKQEKNWTTAQSAELYRTTNWSDGYFTINAQGNVHMQIPANPHAGIDLKALTQSIQQTGLNLPVLVRFQDILQDRVARLCQAFQQAFTQQQLDDARFTAVYPVKVNQQESVVRQIIKGQENNSQTCVGLEAGSKPELMIILGIAPANSLIVCNGYKDREFIRLALISQLMGHRTIIVIEKLSELKLVLQESKKLDIKPQLGLRVRLASLGKGQWQNTGGERAKFGLSASQVLQLVDILKEHQALDCLQLLHFHMGSQIANLDDIHRGMREASRYFVELNRLGAKLQFADVGGGLGIDYDGTASTNTYSINYDLLQYATAIVSTLKNSCAAAGEPFPQIITEAGRFMTAHHAVLITNIVDVEAEDYVQANLPKIEASYHPLIQQLSGMENASLQTLESHRANILLAYENSELSLQERAVAEHYLRYWLTANPDLPVQARLADKYFANFSLFQSLPDIWGIDQVFPIMPLQQLQEKPEREVILQDMTCDSDGTIHAYVSSAEHQHYLPLHAMTAENRHDYLIAFFLVGAYQEILGDLHNLFGDTDSINVRLKENNQYELLAPEHGDTVDELLRTIHYDPKNLLATCKQKLTDYFLQTGIHDNERKLQFYREIEAGFIGYTYLED
jgi:arginine decarboxylase